MSFKKIANEEKAKLKELSFKGKLQYFWDYYKFVLVILLVIVIIVWLGVDIYKGKQIKTGLYVMTLNSSLSDMEDSPFTTGFSKSAGFDKTGEVVTFDTSASINLDQQDTMTMSSITKVMAVMSTGELDVMIMPQDVYEYYAKAGALADWKDVLSPEDYEKYKDKMVQTKADDTTTMNDYGLRIEDSKYIKETGITVYTPVIISPIVSSKRLPIAAEYAKFLLEGK